MAGHLKFIESFGSAFDRARFDSIGPVRERIGGDDVQAMGEHGGVFAGLGSYGVHRGGEFVESAEGAFEGDALQRVGDG